MSTVFTLRYPSVAPVNEIQVDTSVGRKPRVFRGMENAPCMRTFQYRSEPGGTRNPKTSAQLFGVPRWCRARWRRQGAVSEGFVKSTDIVSAAASPRSTIEITCNHVNLLRNHERTQ